MNKVIFLLQAILLVVDIISNIILTRIQKKQNNRQNCQMTVVFILKSQPVLVNSFTTKVLNNISIYSQIQALCFQKQSES